jgi:hypothetical protein
VGEVSPASADWTAPRICRGQLSELGVLRALEEMDEEARARVLAYAVSRWRRVDETGAGQ